MNAAAQKRVLVVDDWEDHLYLMQALLEGHGYQVDCAHDGAKALAMARRHPPDLLISDILMPVMDGFKLCLAWRADSQLQHIPLVFYTATYMDPADQAFGLSLGADAYLVKPLEPDDLINRLRAVMETHALRTVQTGQLAVLPEEAGLLREYNVVLIHKLEQKMAQLEASSYRVRQGGERLMLALEAAHAGIWDWDLTGNTLFVSDQYAMLLGLTAQGFSGNPDELHRSVHSEDLADFLDRIDQARQQRTEFAHEYRILLPDGSVRWVTGRGRFFYNSIGTADRMCGVLTDRTDQKLAEARIERLTRLYHALSEVNQAILRMDDDAELFSLVCRIAVNFGGMKMAWIGQLNELSGMIEPVMRYGSELDYLEGIAISSGADLPQGRGPVGVAFRENHSVVINDYKSSPVINPWAERIARHGFYAVGSFPIPRNARPFAVLTVYSDQKNVFDAEIITLLEEMATDISFALDNFDRRRQQQQVEGNLRESERRFRTLFEQASVGVAMIEPSTGKFVQVNGYYIRLLGYTEEEFRHLTVRAVAHPEDYQFWEERLAALVAGEITEFTHEKRYIHKNGKIFWVSVTVSPMWTKNEQPTFCIVVMMDITERKLSEELIWRQANFDTLTNLPNRRMFRDRLEQALKKSDREQLPLALLLIDLDQFKEVNDTLGHELGDFLLKEAAHRISASVRESDTVARLGGDEFTVVLANVEDNSSVENVAQKILNGLTVPFHLNNEVVFISASIGITLYPNDAGDIDTLMKHADQAMYEAKNKGRRRFNYFT